MIRTTKRTLAIASTVAAATAILGEIGFAGPVLAEDDSSTLTNQPLLADRLMSASPTVSPECLASVGDPATVEDPGIGEVTVTITVCDWTITKASSVLSQSNFGRNKRALAAMDQLVPEYALVDIDMISYSGATYTAEAYRTSLKSAMVKAGLPHQPAQP